MKFEMEKNDILKIVLNKIAPTPTIRIAGMGGFVDHSKFWNELNPLERRFVIKGLISKGWGQGTIARKFRISKHKVRFFLQKEVSNGPTHAKKHSQDWANKKEINYEEFKREKANKKVRSWINYEFLNSIR